MEEEAQQLKNTEHGTDKKIKIKGHGRGGAAAKKTQFSEIPQKGGLYSKCTRALNFRVSSRVKELEGKVATLLN
jgi:hypothetical protein